MTPISSGNITPPLKIVIQRHRVGWRGENRGTSHHSFRRRTGVFVLRGRSLGDRDITGRCDELGKFLVGNIGAVHPETVDINPMDGLCVVHRVHSRHGADTFRWYLAAHGKFAAGNPYHPLWWVGRRGRLVGKGRPDTRAVSD